MRRANFWGEKLPDLKRKATKNWLINWSDTIFTNYLFIKEYF